MESSVWLAVAFSYGRAYWRAFFSSSCIFVVDFLGVMWLNGFGAEAGGLKGYSSHYIPALFYCPRPKGQREFLVVDFFGVMCSNELTVGCMYVWSGSLSGGGTLLLSSDRSAHP